MKAYKCCICHKNVTTEETPISGLDPCALVLVSNIDHPRENQKEQIFYCHFDCFRRLVDDDRIMYIMKDDFATIGDIEQAQDTLGNEDEIIHD